MNVYKLAYPEGAQWVRPVRGEDDETLRFDGTPRLSTWQPIPAYLDVTDDSGKPRVLYNFAPCSGSGILMLDERAKHLIGEWLEPFGELLPLSIKEGPAFWAYNVTRVVDALDVGQSEIVRGTATGAIMMVRKHVFLADVVAGQTAFKIPELLRTSIFVNDEFVSRIRDSGLTGLEFSKVWSG